MALAGELAKYIGGELVKNTGEELATKAATSALSNLAPKIATKAGASMANKIGNELIAGSVLDKLVPTNRMLDKAGRPVTLYHSTPNNFDKFDDAMLGSNTGYDNTALGHFVTPDKDFSKRFIDIDNVGKTGRTMELQANVKNPITHPYMAGQKYDGKELDKKVEDYFIATNNQDGLESLRELAEEDGTSLYDAYMDLTFFGGDSPFEYSADDRKALLNNGYDAVEIVEGPKSGLVEGAKSNAPVSSYAVFNGENLRPVRHIPINQVSNTEEVPVSTLRNLFRGQLYSDTDFSYNSPSMNSGDSAGSQALGGAYHFTPDESKAKAWADNAGGGVIKIGYKPDQLLKADDARRMIQEAADKLNDGAYMSKLWQTDPELAEQIELVGIGNLEALAKREGKPFVEHINANDNELGTIYYYKDVDEGLTEKFREQFRKTKAEKYLGKPKVQQSLVSPDVNMSYYDGYGSSGGFAKDVKAIGTKDVAPIDPDTLPEGYDFYRKVSEKNKAKYGWVYDEVSKATGKPARRITNADLRQFLEDNYPDYAEDGKMTKYELEQRIQDAMEDELTDEAWENGADLSALVHNKYPRAGIRDIYNDHSGRTGKLDRELSRRLGIGESNSVMMDRLNNDTGRAAGDVAENRVGIKFDNWSSDEDKVGVMGHERLHLFQNASKRNDFNYEQVKPVYQDLHEDLKKALLNEDEIRKAHAGSEFERMGGMSYWGSDIEQEARMLEAYLYSEGYVKARPYRVDEFASKMDIIKPAFDKFFKKLRALSKKGVALPAVAGLVGIGTLAGKKDDEKLDNVE